VQTQNGSIAGRAADPKEAGAILAVAVITPSLYNLRHPINARAGERMTPEERKHMDQLCTLIQVERDPAEMSKLVEELNSFLGSVLERKTNPVPVIAQTSDKPLPDTPERS
jgi:hypothetical protein